MAYSQNANKPLRIKKAKAARDLLSILQEEQVSKTTGGIYHKIQIDLTYNSNQEDIINFHVHFESIHPFHDGNGRIGRLIMFKECLANNIIPFINYK